jgi:SAM-dependent methyltransferase
MLAMARARANREAVRNLTLIATGGERLEGLRNRRFNVALCRWGFMFFERPVDALKAVRAHLVPRGSLVSALWGAPEGVSWWSAPRRVLAKHAPQPSISFTSPGPFRYARSEAFRGDLSSAGFECEHEESVETPIMEAATPEGLVAWCLTFGLASALKDLPDAIRRAWCRDMLAEAERHRDEDGIYRLGGTTRLVVARAN